jgi:hypothetical protein
VQVEEKSTADTVNLSIADGGLSIDQASGRIALGDHVGRVLNPEIAPFSPI